jgi:hypothetical protein
MWIMGIDEHWIQLPCLQYFRRLMGDEKMAFWEGKKCGCSQTLI